MQDVDIDMDVFSLVENDNGAHSNASSSRSDGSSLNDRKGIPNLKTIGLPNRSLNGLPGSYVAFSLESNHGHSLMFPD